VFLIQVAASKTKIYMVLELVNGGELLDRIVSRPDRSFFLPCDQLGYTPCPMPLPLPYIYTTCLIPLLSLPFCCNGN
jgi:hypothetical protein